MVVLSTNHRATRIMLWTFLASRTLKDAQSAIAKVAMVAPLSSLIIGTMPKSVGMPGYSSLDVSLSDVSYWVLDDQMLGGVAMLDDVGHNRTITINFPLRVKAVEHEAWGLVDLQARIGSISTSGLVGLATGSVVLSM